MERQLGEPHCQALGMQWSPCLSHLASLVGEAFERAVLEHGIEILGQLRKITKFRGAQPDYGASLE
jgi:hypothetical protein